jgi:hypothetical protein
MLPHYALMHPHALGQWGNIGLVANWVGLLIAG